jgi:hypothetical protein
MSLGSIERPAPEDENLTAICEQMCLDNVGSLTSDKPIGLHIPHRIVLLPLNCREEITWKTSA